MKSKSKRLPARRIGAKLFTTTLTVAMSAGPQNLAWAACSDGTQFPSGGYIVGQPPLQNGPANWSPNVFTATQGSVWVPDTSHFEDNDASKPLTGGGHNWVFDQGSTLCREVDVGAPGSVATGWSIPPNNPTQCVVLPVIKGGRVVNLGDIPGHGDVITPTCNPAMLSTAGAPNPANTYFNQLGCSISHGVATTPETATSYLFVAGIKGGLFSIPLNNASPASAVPVGSLAGKTVGAQNYYSDIPEGQLLTDAAVAAGGHFVIATSARRKTYVYACNHPLGNPGDPSQPINPNFFVPPAAQVKCMVVGQTGLAVTLATQFGDDRQPYFGGQRVVNTFNSTPGGNFPSAWPNCIWQNNGSTSIEDAFNNHRANGCGNAVANAGFTSALITQPGDIRHHKGTPYMYTGPVGGTIVQFKITKDPISGFSQYRFRTYLTGVSLTTGLGIAEDQKSLMVFTDPSAVGLAGQEVITKLPLCEDMP